jgi:hypothetical protein
MARTRQIKHAFFLNEDLAAMDPYARLLFAGLWILADREGRLEDRPAKIKAQIFPYNDVDIESLLLMLACGFITRYSCAGKKFIAVNSFKVHQHCHKDEKDSVFPSPKNAKKITIPTSVDLSANPVHPPHKNAYKPVSLISNPVACISNLETDIAPSPSDSKPPVLLFTAVGKKEWGLTEEKIAEWTEAYPGVNVLAECRKARQWCIDNPTKNKTAKGMPAFLSRWLSRAQDSGKSRPATTTHDEQAIANAKFKQFQEREAAEWAEAAGK